ncbi:hypothetical protein FBULB1_5889 [Fusarium bulbicola]|nr:hypothetical protein FBULB1_5889 [Fusarium bulbicola]
MRNSDSEESTEQKQDPAPGVGLRVAFHDGQFPLADAPVNPLKTASGRSNLQEYIAWVMPSWNKHIDSEWKTAENKVCQGLASASHKSASESWFEYQVASHRDVPGWPWEGITHKDLKSPQDKNSSVYGDYLKMHESDGQKNNPVEESTIAQDKNEVENVEKHATKSRVLDSSELNPRALEFRPLQD